MPRYEVVNTCYGFMERMWEKGTIVEIRNPPADLPRHFKLLNLLKGETAPPPRVFEQVTLESLMSKVAKGNATLSDIELLQKKVADLQAGKKEEVKDLEDIPVSKPPLDLLDDDEDEQEPVEFTSPESGLTATVIAPPPEPVEINKADGTTVKVVPSVPDDGTVRVDASPAPSKAPKVIKVTNKTNS